MLVGDWLFHPWFCCTLLRASKNTPSASGTTNTAATHLARKSHCTRHRTDQQQGTKDSAAHTSHATLHVTAQQHRAAPAGTAAHLLLMLLLLWPQELPQVLM